MLIHSLLLPLLLLSFFAMPCHVHVSLPEKYTKEQVTDDTADETKDFDTKYLEPTDQATLSKHSEPLLLGGDAVEMVVNDSLPKEVTPDIMIAEKTSRLEPVIRPNVLGLSRNCFPQQISRNITMYL